MEYPPAKRNPEIEKLIQENLRLVLKIANDFIGRGLSWEDLVAEGNIGLMTAAEKFDPQNGAKFSTYSAWWIKQAIRQAIAEQSKTIRVPIGTQVNFRRIAKAERKLVEKFGREPSDHELAHEAKLPLATIRRLRKSPNISISSLNDLVFEDDSAGGEFIDSLTSENDASPDAKMIEIEEIEQLFELLETLPEKERQVLRLRFGLDGEPIRTLDEVGKIMNCTNERVRQIQNQALRTLHDLMDAAQ